MRAMSPLSFVPSKSAFSRSGGRRAIFRVAVVAILFHAATLAHAAPPTYVGPRAQGMGGALRAVATGDAGPMLNPSGMSLVRTYVLEGAYQYLPQADQNVFHASLVDSLSNRVFAAGLSYTYQRVPAGDYPSLRGHDVGLSLSAAAGPRASFGATVKYLHIAGGSQAKLEGVTFDAGATLRPMEGWSMAVVGTNLRNLSSPQAPVTLGGGVGFTGVTDLVLDVDVVLDFGKEQPGRGNHVGVMGGAEYLFGRRVGARLGGGRDPVLDHGFVSAGLGVFGDLGAIDAGWRQDVSGSARQTYLGISFRLFVPEPQEGP